MDPKVLAYITYAEQLAALASQAVVSIKDVISGAKDPTAALADADSTYQSVIATAKPATT